MMFAYHVNDTGSDRVSNTRYFWCRADPITYESKAENLVVLRDDYKFAVYMDKVYRVCEVNLWDDPRENFVKVWDVDPFAGFDDYEQIPASVE